LDLTESDTQKGVPAQGLVYDVQMRECNKPRATLLGRVPERGHSSSNRGVDDRITAGASVMCFGLSENQ